MSFVAKLQRARETLEQQGRLSTRALARELEIGGDELTEIIDELVDVQHLARREGTILVWAAAPGQRAESALRASAPTDHARVTEARKVVTIVFADLAGSTALHERLDPESVRTFMDSYYRAMRGAVEANGGTIVKLLGDGVMAVFGVPRVAEDDAMRAVRAGVEMQRAFRELAREQLAAVGDIGLRVAINTGEVVVSADNSDLVGDPVNVAARMQQEARDGDVVIGEATRRLVRELVTLAPVGTFTLKGRAEPVAAYRVASLDRPGGTAATAFVGRDEEVQRVMTVYDTAVGEQRARLVVVLGSPGLGKSRLLDEVGCRVADQATVLTAHCDATRGATFAPVAAALRAFMRVASASEDALRTAVTAALRDDADQARIVGGITSLLGGTPSSPEETFFVIRRFIAALGATRPVVLAIDDLQWAEPLLLDLVEHLVQWGAGVPLLVLAAARPDLRELRSSLAQTGALVSDVVTLAGLDAAAATQLAANVIGAAALPAVVAGRVLAASEGNPLFVGELVRMLVNDGALKQEGDRWTTTVELATVEMPPTIHALLAARIERLRAEDRLVLERAAIVGRRFSRAAVAHLLPRETQDDLDARLEALRRSELIEPDTTWLLGEPALRFHHGLTRDAAYRRVLKGTRADLHARFAEWIESRVDQLGTAIEHDETIGWHLEQAHQHLRELGPLDTQGRALGERAARYLAAAGRRALARDDVSVAADLLGRAIDRLDADDPARADLALDWCEALLSLGDVAQGQAAIDELARLIRDNPRFRAWHVCFAAQLAVLTDPRALHGAAAAVASAADELAAAGDRAGEAKAHLVHALALSRLGKIGACEAALDKALAAARRVHDRRRANTVLANAPLAALWGPSSVTRASGRCLDVVRVLRITEGAPTVEAVALRCQAVLESLRGRTEAARRMIESSRRMVEELGITQGLLETEMSAGLIALNEGDTAVAEQNLRAAYDGLRHHGLRIDAARAAALLGRSLLAQDRAAEAEALSHESEALAGDDLEAAITWRRVRAEALARRGEHTAAVEFARAAVDIAAATDALLHHADARRALAAALRAAGRSDEADAEEVRAIELWVTKGATVLAERARRDRGRAVQPAQSLDEHSGRERPTLRRARANAATAIAARLNAAFASRDADALHRLLAEGAAFIDHTARAEFDRRHLLASWQAMLRVDGLTYRLDAIATLGACALCNRVVSASGVTRGDFDVGAYENETVNVIEVDTAGRLARLELFSADHLGDAIARLYERHAELLPEGPAHVRAAATARTLARLFQPIRHDSWTTNVAAVIAPDIEVVDRRILGSFSSHGAKEMLDNVDTWYAVGEHLSQSVEDVLALQPDRLLVRATNRFIATGPVGGGDFEIQCMQLYAFGSDGLMSRLELLDADREAEALARFDALEAKSPAARPTRSRVRPNAATENAARMEAALAARDADAFFPLIADEFEGVHHPTGAIYDRGRSLDSMRALLRAENLTLSNEHLATLGDSLTLCRQFVSASGVAAGKFDIGPYEHEHLMLLEVDATGRRRRSEQFAGDHLGDAIARVYERYAEPLADGPDRERAVAVARSVAAWLGPPDRWPFAPDVEATDHRTVGFGSLRGAESVAHGVRALLDLSDDFVCRVDDVLGLRADALLLRWTNTGTVRASGGAFERSLCQLCVFGNDGLVVRWEQFDAEQSDEAVARFDELATVPPAPRPVQRRVRPNAATALISRQDALVTMRDMQALSDLFSDETRVEDHINHTAWDRKQTLSSWRSLLSAHEPTCRHEPLATLGDPLVLCRVSVGAGGLARGSFDVGAYEKLDLQMIEADAQGRRIRTEVFAVDHLGDAVARLYERYAELLPEGAERARSVATARAVAVVVGPIDIDRYATAFAPAVESIDHRVLGTWPARGAEALLRHYRSVLEVADDVEIRNDEVLGLRSDALLLKRTHHGTARVGGGAYERPFLAIYGFDADGLLTLSEAFDCDREDAALTRFDELATVPPAPRPVQRRVRPNAATAQAGRVDAAIAARDVDALPTLLADDLKVVDHATGVDFDRQGALSSWRVVLKAENPSLAHEPLATLGDSLALCRMSMAASGFVGRTFDVGAYEQAEIAVIEVDAQGRERRRERFAADQLSAGVVRLYERYGDLLPDGPERARAVATSRTVAAFVGQQPDYDCYAGTVAPLVDYVDHRILGMGSARGREVFLRGLRSLFAVADDMVNRVDDVLALRSDACLLRMTNFGIARVGGGAYERPFLAIFVFGADGLLTRQEQFDAEQDAEALSRFDDLVGGACAETADLCSQVETREKERFENVATRTWDRMMALWLARDWTGYAGVHAAGFRFLDRRRLMLLDLDREAWVAHSRFFGDMASTHIDSELLATRGERLALSRQRTQVAGADVGPSELDYVNVLETDAQGDAVAMVRFDPDDLEAAYTELDARWAASEAAEHPRASAWIIEFRRSFASRDWDAIAALHAPDQVAYNHRLVGWGTLSGPRAWMPTLQQLVALAPDVQQVARHLRTCERGILLQYSWQGTYEGGAFETPLVFVVELDEDGRQRRLDVWDPEALDAALARFEEIRMNAASDSLAAIAKPNAASAAMDRWQTLLNKGFDTGDWHAMRAICSPGFVFDDRRRFSLVSGDRELMIASLRARATMGARPQRRLVGTAGDRVAIERVLWSGGPHDGRFETENLRVVQVDASGLVTAIILFDLDDARAAQREAWARWVAIEPDVAATVALISATADAFNDHDSTALRGLCADDLAYEDHRRTGVGRIDGADAVVNSIVALWNLAPVHELEFGWFWPAYGRRGAVSVVRRFGTLPDAGAFESEYLQLGFHSKGRLAHVELFELEDLDEALARFAELCAASGDAPA